MIKKIRRDNPQIVQDALKEHTYSYMGASFNDQELKDRMDKKRDKLVANQSKSFTDIVIGELPGLPNLVQAEYKYDKNTKV